MSDFVTFDDFIPIPNFENYGISKCGEICSFKKKKLLKQGKWGAYKNVALSKNGKIYYFRVHRLVAATFIPNPKDLPQVNHKDGNKFNNDVTNLEWCTCSYNIKHGYDTGLSKSYWKGKSRDTETIEKIRKTKIGTKQNEEWIQKRTGNQKGKNHPRATKVAQYDLEGNFIREYDLVKEAAESNGLRLNNVSACLRGKSKTSGGYIWKYAVSK